MKRILLLTALVLALPLSHAAPPAGNPNAGPHENGPVLPEEVTLSGDYTVKWNPVTGIVRLEGRIEMVRGKSSLRSLDDDAWLEILPNGNFRTSKGRWETVAVDEE